MEMYKWINFQKFYESFDGETACVSIITVEKIPIIINLICLSLLCIIGVCTKP